jgi:hypothetical protein
LLIVANGEDGHRREYIALFEGLAASAGVPSVVRKLRWRDVLHRAVLLSPMLEEHTIRFAVVAAGRSLLGRRSVALLFRPREAAHSASLGHRLKRLGLGLLRRAPAIDVLTILPFAVDPAFSTIARGWIYDPQLWDLGPRRHTAPSPLARAVRSAAAGRKVVVALGAQNAGKGFDYLTSVWLASAELRETWFFVAAGRVAPASRAAADAFTAEGGLLVDRFIEDAELQDLYDVADLVWACYAPDYDQASGIFGRAVQLGVPAAIRAGSYLESLASAVDQPVVALPWGEPDAAARRLADAPSRIDPDAARAKADEMRAASVATLARALRLPLTTAGAAR